MVRRPSVVHRGRRPQCLNILFSETVCPIKAKFYVAPTLEAEMKICSRHLSHMTKMAATPIYGKSNRKAMNRNWSNQKSNPALKTKAGNK